MKNQIFKSKEFGQIRTCMMDGETYFVGKDVASALGYKNTKDALMRHVDEDDKRGSGITTPLGIQQATIINESGLYSLILSSKLESAKRFKRWVPSEVLPAIRKNGRYELEQQLVEADGAESVVLGDLGDGDRLRAAQDGSRIIGERFLLCGDFFE